MDYYNPISSSVLVVNLSMGNVMTYDEACKTIANDPKTNEYAKAYANAGIGMTGHEARVQTLYILNNISSWRGDKAKQVRAFLKDFSKERG